MKLYALGVHGWMPWDDLLTSCLAIETNEEVVVLDCGSGFSRIFQYPELLKKPLGIFLSHLHPDHSSGLFFLYALPQGCEVMLYGSPIILDQLAMYLAPPLNVLTEELKKKIKISRVDLFSVLPLKHSIPCFGWHFAFLMRLGKSFAFAYCTDTGLCENLKSLASKKDVLVLECTWTDPTFEDEGHLNPRTAAQVAKDAGAGRLLLTHFTGDRPGGSFATEENIKEAESVARQIFPNTTALIDGMVLDL